VASQILGGKLHADATMSLQLIHGPLGHCLE
jgi:hypothetical protein